MTGHRCGNEASPRIGWGIELFADERGSTTIAAAVAILVSLALVFTLANVQWVTSRAADIQAVADAGALAGMNAVSAYVTAAQVLDALVLSLGLIGLLAMAIGLILAAIPAADVAGPPVLDAASKIFETREKLARTAAQGLKNLENALPYLVVANSLAVVRANAGEGGAYVGAAIPFPLEGESDFGTFELDDARESMEQAGEVGEEIDALSQQAEEAKQQADEALERGWYADCGGNVNLRERAASLAGLVGASNPNYPTSTGWNFGVPIRRAQAYYAQRLTLEIPGNASPAEATRSAARAAFYRYAYEQVGVSTYAELDDGTVLCDLRRLPTNTEEVRQTTLYTDAIWPCTEEELGAVIHSYNACPGATGPLVRTASLADEETGLCARCPVCQFDVVDVGRAPAASSAIDNGFEYYWIEIVNASEDYMACRAEQVVQERAAKDLANQAVDMFQRALERLSATRVNLVPPGRYGCVCVVADPQTHLSPEGLAGLAGGTVELPARAAVSAAILARDSAAAGNNILADFFDGIVSHGGFIGGTSAILDGVISAWGNLLVMYEGGYDAFKGALSSSFAGLSGLGLGGVGVWIENALDDAVRLTGMQPADMSAKKPVLVNSADVMDRVGNNWYSAVRSMVLALQTVDGNAGPDAVLGAIGVFVQTMTGEETLAIGEFQVPGTDVSIPIEVDLGWLAGLGEAA